MFDQLIKVANKITCDIFFVYFIDSYIMHYFSLLILLIENVLFQMHDNKRQTNLAFVIDEFFNEMSFFFSNHIEQVKMLKQIFKFQKNKILMNNQVMIFIQVSKICFYQINIIIKILLMIIQTC